MTNSNINPPDQQGPLSLDKALMLATTLQNEGQLDRAQELLERIIQVSPKHAHALHLLGVIAHQRGQASLAIQWIQQAIAENSSVALFHANLGEMLRQSQNIELSILHGQRAVSLDPYSAGALSNLGIAYYDKKHYDEAQSCHQRALALDPKQSNSLNNLGSIYKEHKNNQEAIRLYQAAIACSPHFADPHNNLGAVLIIEQRFNEAILFLSKALELDPHSIDAHCNIGFAFNGVENFSMALKHFQRAVELNPDHAEAFIGLAMLYCALFDFETAKTFADQAIELSPDKAEFYQSLAIIYWKQGNSSEALSYFDRALALDPCSSSTLIAKGNLLVELGESDAAKPVFDQVLDDPKLTTQVPLHYSLVQLQTIKPGNKSLQTLLSLLAQVDSFTPQQQEYLYFSLGKCYDDLGECPIAFEYFAKGCQVKRNRITYSADEEARQFQRIIHCFTEKTIDSLKQFANPSATPLFILGMPRSGTTLIEQIIASHPDVYGAGELLHLGTLMNQPIETPAGTLRYPENMLYFTAKEAAIISDEYLSYLQSLMPAGTRAAHITDKMPGNFVAIGLIHALFPQAKIIHVERNPIDTCLSCYTKLFTHKHFYSFDLIELGQFYANYRNLMAHWRQVLPADSWLDVRYEDVVSNLESEAKRLIAYCGLNWDPACLSFHNLKRQVSTASYTQVRRPIYSSSVERWRRFEKELLPLINVLNENGCL